MREPLSLVVFANGWVSKTEIGPPTGREPVYSWAGPVFCSLATLLLGLWHVRGRHTQSVRERLLLWTGVGCLAVCYSTCGLQICEGREVFQPTWVDTWAFSGLAGLALGWWLIRGRLGRPGPFRPLLEAFAGCLAVGYFLWWFSWAVFDLNWRGTHGWLVWSIVAMPWLWAGACSAIVWREWRNTRSPAGRRIQTAFVTGACVGFLGWCVLGNLVSGLFDGIRSLVLEDMVDRYDKDARLRNALIDLGLFLFGGALLSGTLTWLSGSNSGPAHAPSGEPTRLPAPPAGEAPCGR
jgi:hypothetical protein